MNTHTGGCHCGAVAYEVEGDLASAITCNCSHCKKKGVLLSFVPESAFTLKQGAENLTTYRFNKHVIDHQFCKTCGVQSFSKGKDSEGNTMIAVNLNCVEGIDTDAVNVTKYDGASA